MQSFFLPMRLVPATVCLFLLSICAAELPAGEPYFQIQVVDAVTGRGVPLVQLETVNNIQYFTDSAGYVAFYEPGLMDREVFFYVRSHGYEYPADGFGFRGVRLQIKAGGSATIKLPRQNIAERLYRVTGEGIYRDTLLLGKQPPLAEPVINAHVVGSDSVVNALYRNRLYWFWGDTNRPGYPLGNYQVPGAFSQLPGKEELDASQGVNLNYFTGPDGFAKSVAKIPGRGPTWIFGLTVLKNQSGQEELWTGYAKIEAPLRVYARGVARFNDEKSEFDNMAMFDSLPVLFPEGQALTLRDSDTEYVYFCTPYPLVRVKATPEAYRDPQQYEAYTCLKEGSTLETPQIDRDADGRARYAWKHQTPAVNPAAQAKLIQTSQLKQDEALLPLRDRDTGKVVHAHTGTVNWNAYRKRWIMLLVEIQGTSHLGEMWYSEADSPLGPWVYAVKVLTHQKYSFYNPRQHPYFDQEGGRLVYFEGTYTHSFSGNNVQTPRYDYNQMMYRLDLADPRLAIPVPVHETLPNRTLQFGTPQSTFSPPVKGANFLALNHPGTATIPIYGMASENGMSLTTSLPEGQNIAPLFHAIALDTKDAPATTGALFEYVHSNTGQRHYDLNPQWAQEGFQRTEKPICRVWRNP